jgi:multiple sugar transport system ATP-binding protein
LRLGSQELPFADRIRTAHPGLAGYGGKPVIVGIRPENLPAANGSAEAVLSANVDLIEALGSELQVHFSIDAKRVLAEGPSDADELTSSGAGVARVGPHVPARPGETLQFAVELDALHFFDPETGKAIY